MKQATSETHRLELGSPPFRLVMLRFFSVAGRLKDREDGQLEARCRGPGTYSADD